MVLSKEIDKVQRVQLNVIMVNVIICLTLSVLSDSQRQEPTNSSNMTEKMCLAIAVICFKWSITVWPKVISNSMAESNHIKRHLIYLKLKALDEFLQQFLIVTKT